MELKNAWGATDVGVRVRVRVEDISAKTQARLGLGLGLGLGFKYISMILKGSEQTLILIESPFIIVPDVIGLGLGLGWVEA